MRTEKNKGKAKVDKDKAPKKFRDEAADVVYELGTIMGMMRLTQSRIAKFRDDGTKNICNELVDSACNHLFAIVHYLDVKTGKLKD